MQEQITYTGISEMTMTLANLAVYNHNGIGLPKPPGM